MNWTQSGEQYKLHSTAWWKSDQPRYTEIFVGALITGEESPLSRFRGTPGGFFSPRNLKDESSSIPHKPPAR